MQNTLPPQPQADPASNLDDALLRVSIRTVGASKHLHEAIAGLHLVDLMRAHALPVKAECGGACVCATCDVRGPEDWQDRLPPPSDEELAKLDEIPGADATSCLACLIVMTPDLDGLEIELQLDSHRIGNGLTDRINAGQRHTMTTQQIITANALNTGAVVYLDACRLREQWGYRGELRASGDALFDQLPSTLLDHRRRNDRRAATRRSAAA